MDSLAAAAARGEDPAELARRQAEQAREALAAVGGATRWIVELTRRYLRLREDQRFHFDRLLWAWKRAWLWLEQDLGLELRFLDAEAAERALAADEDGVRRAAERIARISEAWASEVARRAVGDEPPDFLSGEHAVVEPPPGAAARLQGLGVSAGVVTGRVRVVRSLDEIADRPFEAGDILVCRATDPGWTPLFLTAGGLVMELGSLLSHGAVVAREYRLPAVVNLGGATTRLEDGQTVTVDGKRGAVWVR